jgi:hypothetical protein
MSVDTFAAVSAELRLDAARLDALTHPSSDHLPTVVMPAVTVPVQATRPAGRHERRRYTGRHRRTTAPPRPTSTGAAR